MKLDSKTPNNIIYTLVYNSFFSKRRSNTSLWVALLGISIGICSIISVIGIMNGMQKLLIDDLIHIESYDYVGTASYDDMDTIITQLESYSQISLVQPFIDEFTFIETIQGKQVLHLRALLSSQANKDTQFLHALSLDNYTASENTLFTDQPMTESAVFEPTLCLGWSLSGVLGVSNNSPIQLSFFGDTGGITPIQIKGTVSDIFFTGSHYDTQWAFMSLEEYMKIKPTTNTIQFGIRVSSHRKIRPILDSALSDVSSWQESNSAFYIALKTEKTILIILSAMIFLVIILHFRFTMMRRIRNKKDDIVTLRTMGLQPTQIQLWFLGETIIICILGVIIGSTLGIAFIYGYPRLYEWMFLNFGISIDMGNLTEGTIGIIELILVLGISTSMILCTIWIVVRKSATLIPMKVLRYE